MMGLATHTKEHAAGARVSAVGRQTRTKRATDSVGGWKTVRVRFCAFHVGPFHVTR